MVTDLAMFCIWTMNLEAGVGSWGMVGQRVVGVSVCFLHVLHLKCVHRQIAINRQMSQNRLNFETVIVAIEKSPDRLGSSMDTVRLLHCTWGINIKMVLMLDQHT